MIRGLIVSGLVAAATAQASAATVREARVTVVFSDGGCDVRSRFVIDTADPAVVEHRLMTRGGSVPRFVVLGGIAQRAEVAGRTVRLPISLAGSGRNEYSVRFHVALAADTGHRCPLLVPEAPTDGAERSIRLDVEVPAGAAVLPGAFPSLTWTDRRGTVAISHLPSFVRVPHAAPGARLTWVDRLDVRKLIDGAAVTAVSVSTLAWIALRRRRR
jgi:hypothetical protein